MLQVVQEYERAVIFRLGRLRQGGAKGPGKTLIFFPVDFESFEYEGIFFVLPCVDHYKKVDLRTVSFDVPVNSVK